MRVKQKAPSRNGFTLLEILLALGIAATVLLSASGLLGVVVDAQAKTQAAQEVHEQGFLALHQLLGLVRNAETVLAPLPGTTAATLTLDVIPAISDPTSFSVSSDVLQIAEGSTAPQPLTNSRIRIVGFTAENLSRPGTPGTIRIQFTAEHINPQNRSASVVSETFIGSASLR